MVLQFVFIIRTKIFKNFLGGFEQNLIMLNIDVTAWRLPESF